MKSKYLVFIVGILSVCITVYQMFSTHSNNELKLELEQIKSEREWKYKLTEFMAKHRENIFSNDIETIQQMQKIMLVSFPKSITNELFQNLAKISEQGEWKNAHSIFKRLEQPTVYIHIVKGFPSGDIISLIGDTIGGGDISYFTNDEYVDSTLTTGDVRYFFEEDKALAITVLNDFESLACTQGYQLNLKLIPLIQNSDKNIKGTIEVWLSPDSIKKAMNRTANCYER